MNLSSHVSLAGLKDLGDLLLSKFKWGHTFFELNREILDEYAACRNDVDVILAERRYLDELEKSAGRSQRG